MFLLRPLRPEDESFLLKLYASTRAEELAAWGWDKARQETFIKMQFTAQQRWYQAAYPQAEHQLIILKANLIGHILVLREKTRTELIDISLLPEYRNRGVGTALLGELIEECRKSGVPLRLQVQCNNQAAIRLYRRLGFSTIEQDDVYCRMERRSYR
jgi:ribosomal protein S18 acetylase RimI-like enzyme